MNDARRAAGLVVVKLGGSLVTKRDGDAYKVLDEDGLARLAHEVAGHRGPLVVVHGAGSYGHPLAREHRLHDAAAPRTRERMEAFAQVHQDVSDLAVLVARALRTEGLRPVLVKPAEVAHLHAGVVDRFDLDAFARPLAFGLTPVTFGDAVHDDVLGWGILGGDPLAARLAVGLGASRLLHATDVEGVLDRPPGPDARLLATLDAAEAERLAGSAGPAAGRADVTGGMAGKLRTAAEAARGGTDVLILDGRVPGRLAEALAGKDVPGTRIRGVRA